MTDCWPWQLVIRPLTPDDARRIARWRYAGPWQVYNSRGLIDPGQGYAAVAAADDGRLVGYCCAGPEARVPGLAERPGLLDIGLGMAPEWVGQGHGPSFGRAVLDHYQRESAHTGLRAAIQSWNERSLSLTRRLGFAETGRHTCVQDGHPVEYVIVTRHNALCDRQE